MASNNSTKDFFDIPADVFNCIKVDSTDKIDTPFHSDEDFEEKLKHSLERWKQCGIRGLWVKVAIEHSSLIPICTRHGFVFHHAKENYVMLKQWLSSSEVDNLPGYANQYLGCAGFVVNDKNQVLVIKEKHGPADFARWKLPGGLADKGEHISEAAIREVEEETGIKCKFKSVIAFRHQHNFRFGCSDFYFVCLLEPLTKEISMCTQEIQACQWMEIEEYLGGNITEANRYFAEAYLDLTKNGKVSIQPTPIVNYFGRGNDLVYSLQSKGPQNQGEAANIRTNDSGAS